MTVPAYNLILIQIPDLLVGFYKRGNVKEKLPDIKPFEKSEFGPLSYVAGNVISKMYRKSKVSAKKDTPKQLELQSLLLSMKSLQHNEYIDSVSRGKLWNLCENLLAITAECEKVFKQHSAGLVGEIPLQQLRADSLQKPKVKSAWDANHAILFDASLAKSKTSVTDVCLENIVVLYIRVRSFPYSSDVVTKMTIKEKVKFHKKALRKTLLSVLKDTSRVNCRIKVVGTLLLMKNCFIQNTIFKMNNTMYVIILQNIRIYYSIYITIPVYHFIADTRLLQCLNYINYHVPY